MFQGKDITDTIVALATPPGVGAIGVIRLSGKKAISLADDLFFGKKLREEPSHTVHYGTIRHGEQIVDEVVITLFRGPNSYTGEDVVEISCHGSPYILQQVIQLAIERGARMAQPGEYTMRAFLNGKMDLSQAEAVADLIAANSKAAHDIAMHQMRGGFSQEIRKLREELIHFASMIELELDFSEEDVEFANREELRNLVEKIRKLLQVLIDSFYLGNVFKRGVQTVIAGRPNAGKSTLLNVLLREERAIVSEIAGTTRDTIEEVVNIDGIEFRLIDTAGIRDAQDQIEQLGVQKTMEQIQKSTLLLYVFDVTQLEPIDVWADVAKLLPEGEKAPDGRDRIMIVANKMDLNPYVKPEDYVNELIKREQIIPASAINDMNIEYLKEKLVEWVLAGKGEGEHTVVSNARHYEALSKAYESLNDVLKGMEDGITSDFIAMDIRRALTYLGEITGEISTDDLLGNIFSNFCIGK